MKLFVWLVVGEWTDKSFSHNGERISVVWNLLMVKKCIYSLGSIGFFSSSLILDHFPNFILEFHADGPSLCKCQSISQQILINETFTSLPDVHVERVESCGYSTEGWSVELVIQPKAKGKVWIWSVPCFIYRPLENDLILIVNICSCEVELCAVPSHSVMSDSATPWIVAHQAPLSMGFSKQEYWSGLPFPSPGDLPDSGTESRSPVLQADSLPSEPLGKPPEVSKVHICSWEVNRAKLEDEISLFYTKLFPGLTN